MIDDATIQLAATRLHDAAPGSTVILFGSYARGDAEPDSDLDFLVIEPQVSARREEMVRLRLALRPLRVPADVIVVSHATYHAWADQPGTVIHAAAREGKVLNAGA